VKALSQDLASAVTERVQRAPGYPYRAKFRYVDEIDWAASWKKDCFGLPATPVPEMSDEGVGP
jgi:hypothetical protein